MVIRAWNFYEYSVSVGNRRLKGEWCCISRQEFCRENKSAKDLVSSQGRTVRYNRIRFIFRNVTKVVGKTLPKVHTFFVTVCMYCINLFIILNKLKGQKCFIFFWILLGRFQGHLKMAVIKCHKLLTEFTVGVLDTYRKQIMRLDTRIQPCLF